MKQEILGKAFVLGDHIDTDQIIPASRLVYRVDDPKEKLLYGKYALSGVPLERSGLPKGHILFVEPNQNQSNFSIIIAGRNFGCGSSREHAPLALQMAGVKAVVANSYARIFYRNVVDGGYFFPFECEANLVQEIETGDTLCIDLSHGTLFNQTRKKEYALKSLGDALEIISSGGIFEYARKHHLI